MDNIANMFTVIRNAGAVKLETVKIPYSKVKFNIAGVLKKGEWIEDFELKDKGDKAWLILRLKYNKDGSPAISGIKRISRPGKRIYMRAGDLPTVRQGYGIAIVSTPKGIVTNVEARREKVGGEIIAFVY